MWRGIGVRLTTHYSIQGGSVLVYRYTRTEPCEWVGIMAQNLVALLLRMFKLKNAAIRIITVLSLNIFYRFLMRASVFDIIIILFIYLFFCGLPVK